MDPEENATSMGVRKGHVIVASAVYPLDEPPVPLPQASHPCPSFPHLILLVFATVSMYSRACPAPARHCRAELSGAAIVLLVLVPQMWAGFGAISYLVSRIWYDPAMWLYLQLLPVAGYRAGVPAAIPYHDRGEEGAQARRDLAGRLRHPRPARDVRTLY